MQSFLNILLEAFTAVYNLDNKIGEDTLRELLEQVERHTFKKNGLRVVKDEQ